MAGRVVARAEPFYVFAISPLLLFPAFRPGWTAAALAGLALLWLGRAIMRREPWPVTPFNVALLVFCLAIPLAVWASPAPDLTLPKLTGLILGLAAFRVVAFSARGPRGLRLALAALAAVGLAVWGVGLLAMRLPALNALTSRLPQAFLSLPGAEQGINPNQLAGALMILLPLALACALGFLSAGRRLMSVALVAATLIAAATLALTGSRAGWIGAAAAAVTLAAALVWLNVGPSRKRALAGGAIALVIAGAVLGGLIVPRMLGARGDAGAVQGEAVLQQLSLDARIEIWSRALYALQDFPFTGVGLGAFRKVVNVLYPLFLVPPEVDIAHSHNMFLQVGVDLGLIGLTGYVALLLVAAVTAWQVAAGRVGFERYVALGALAALVGLHIYGLADALALGSKPSALFWMLLGLIAALAATPHAADEAPAATPT